MQVGTETWSGVGPKGDYNPYSSPLKVCALIFEGLELGSSPGIPESKEGAEQEWEGLVPVWDLLALEQVWIRETRFPSTSKRGKEVGETRHLCNPFLLDPSVARKGFKCYGYSCEQ